MPDIVFNWTYINEWRLNLERTGGEFHSLTGVWLRGGWHFEFGPLSLFWGRGN